MSGDGRLYYPHTGEGHVILCFGTGLFELNVNTQTGRSIEAWNTPSQRWGFSGVAYQIYSTGILRKYYLLYGGMDMNDVELNEIWRYEVAWAPQRYYYPNGVGNEWLQIDGVMGVPTMSFHSTSIDPTALVMYVYGGSGLYSYDILTNVWTTMV
jgi:hypothetical protein